MREAIFCDDFTDPPTLRIRQFPSIGLKPGQVRVAVTAAGLNFPDYLMVSGSYQKRPQTPFIPGFECAGIVTEVDDAVEDIAVGARVIVLRPLEAACLASEVTAYRRHVHPIPANIGFSEAAAFGVVYATAHYGLHRIAQLQSGETVLVIGAGGGVGVAAVQLAKAAQASVIAMDRGVERLGVAAKFGADITIDGADAARLKALAGVDVVVDLVGGDPFRAALRCVKVGGRVLVIGFASGNIPTVEANYLLLKEFGIFGVNFGNFSEREPATTAAIVAECLRLRAEGRIAPLQLDIRKAEHATQALHALGQGRVQGKSVVHFRE